MRTIAVWIVVGAENPAPFFLIHRVTVQRVTKRCLLAYTRAHQNTHAENSPNALVRVGERAETDPDPVQVHCALQLHGRCVSYP